MDRFSWVEGEYFQPGEKVVAQKATVRLYEGEEKVSILGLAMGGDKKHFYNL